MARIQAAPAFQPRPERNKKIRLVLWVGTWGYLAAAMGYIILPLFIQRRLCTPGTIWCEGSGSVPLLVLGTVLIMVAGIVLLMVLLGMRIPPNQPQRIRGFFSAILALRQRQRVFVAAVLCAISALIWWNFLESYTSVEPDRISIRNGLFGSTRITAWNDVTLVQAECHRERDGSLYGDWRVSLSDSTVLKLPLRFNSENEDYAALRAALAGKHYEYRVAATVGPTRCRPAVYPLLTNWPRP